MIDTIVFNYHDYKKKQEISGKTSQNSTTIYIGFLWYRVS